MYRLITKETRHLYPKTMDDSFRLRHSIFVKENGWSEFDVDGIHERDSFDTDDTIYAIAVGPHEDVIGGFRLVPTTLPHMISEKFPQLVDGAVVSRPDVMEWSRIHFAPEYRGSKTHYLESFAAAEEIGLELGLSAFTCIVRTLRIPMFLHAGIKAEPLGFPSDVDGVSSSAVLVTISDECLEAVNKARGSTSPVLEHHQLRRRVA